MILIFCKNINYCKIVLLDFPIFNRNMRYPGLKIYALWDVQGYKNIMDHETGFFGVLLHTIQSAQKPA